MHGTGDTELPVNLFLETIRRIWHRKKIQFEMLDRVVIELAPGEKNARGCVSVRDFEQNLALVSSRKQFP